MAPQTIRSDLSHYNFPSLLDGFMLNSEKTKMTSALPVNEKCGMRSPSKLKREREEIIGLSTNGKHPDQQIIASS